MLKRFLVFGGQAYYPEAGWNDFRGDFDSKEEALERCANLVVDWWQIVDTHVGTVITHSHTSK